MQIHKILTELAEKFEITPNQARELYDQYWMEYVIKRMHSLRFPKIHLEGLGCYEINIRSLTNFLSNPEIRGEKRKKFMELQKLIIKDKHEAYLKHVVKKSETHPFQSLLYDRYDKILSREEWFEFLDFQQNFSRRRKKKNLSPEMFD